MQCPYSKSNVKIIKTSKQNKYEIYPIYPNYIYTKSKCNSNGIFFDENTGNITISTFEKIEYVNCEINCQYNGNSGKTIITIAVLEYEPYINRYASKIPVVVNSTSNFTAKIVVSYPTVKENEEEFIKQRKTDRKSVV